MVFPGYAKRDRVAALAEGALVPAPIVRTVSCYETRRVGERAREVFVYAYVCACFVCVCMCVCGGERERERERGIRKSKRKSETKNQRLSSQPGGGQTGRLDLLFPPLTPSLLPLSFVFIFPLVPFLCARALPCHRPRRIESKLPTCA